jgi:hypothetical protein
MVGEDAANRSFRRPNLFNFATSELSQDAFICWLVSWTKTGHKGSRLHDCGKDFIAFLYNLKHGENTVSPKDIESVAEPEQQHEKIDVYFQATINQKVVSFIIEDKTHTTFHSDQLKRYLEKIQKDEIAEEEIVCIYFKTGCVWPEEEKETEKIVTEKGEYRYYILNSIGLYDKFLQKHKDIEDPIFRDYSDYIYSEFYRPQEHGWRQLIDKDEKNKASNFDCDSVKLRYMKELLSRCSEPIRKCAEYPYHGKNRDGSTWVIFDFCLRHDEPGFEDYGEHLYCRLDWRKGGYYLAVRQYAKFNKENVTVRESKWNRFQEYREVFETVLKELANPVPFEFDKPVSDWSGKYESEIAVVFFNDSDKSPQNVLDAIPEILKSFVARIDECKESHHA